MTRVLRGAAAGASLLAAACAPSWPFGRSGGDPRVVPFPTATPVRFGPARLRLVLAEEGVPALDAAVREAVVAAARDMGATAEIQTLAAFTAPSAASGAGPGGGVPGGTSGGAIPRGVPGGGAPGGAGSAAASTPPRLLAAVQAGVPPDAVLLLGRDAQLARVASMGLLLDLSSLMRPLWRRMGGVGTILEPFAITSGNWYAAPQYQRLTGYWLDQSALASRNVAVPDPDRPITGDALRLLLVEAARSEDGFWPWGTGSAHTMDVDAWCWSVIHAWGGGLANRAGDRVTLNTPETAVALDWLVDTIGGSPWREAVPPAATDWSDVAKNAALVQGTTALTYTDRLLSAAWAGGTRDGAAGGSGGASGASGNTPASGSWPSGLVYLRAPAGPAGQAGLTARPRAIGGGAVWVMPRGAQVDLVERLLERLLEPATQRRLWQAGGGFALPAYTSGWNDPAVASLPGAAHVRRFRDEQTNGGYVSATGNGGPETAPSQALGEAGLAAGMLRAALGGKPTPDVLDEAHRLAVRVFQDYGLPGD